jgi:hypothetical protein
MDAFMQRQLDNGGSGLIGLTSMFGGGIINTITSMFKTPVVIALVIAGICYYLSSRNFTTKDNLKDKIPLKNQRSSAIKNALYILIILVVILYVFKYAGQSVDVKYQYTGGLPPF